LCFRKSFASRCLSPRASTCKRPVGARRLGLQTTCAFRKSTLGDLFALPGRGGASMESRAKLFGHPIHQMLIAFPLGVLGMSFFFDLIAAGTSRPQLHQAAYYMIAAGVVTGLLAAVFGLIDFLAIPAGTRAKRIGLL